MMQINQLEQTPHEYDQSIQQLKDENDILRSISYCSAVVILFLITLLYFSIT